MATIEDLRQIMARLRDPQNGCPWDTQQNFSTIAPYTIEEAYEVADAIDRNDYAELKDELGDLLLQIIFHARMAEEQSRFNFDDVVDGICDKMIRRHPHVFGDAVVRNTEQQTQLWEMQKRTEREAKSGVEASVLDGIARGLPEWQRATKLQKRAATVGFDWPDIHPVFEKLHEELDEVRAELVREPRDMNKLADEIGDVLFVCVNLARHARVDFGAALRLSNQKFERRFRAMEKMAHNNGQTLSQLDLNAQDRYWNHAKAAEQTK